jgi:acyl carrier protein
METRDLVREVMTEAGFDGSETLDSLDILDLVIALEKKLGIRIPDDKLESLATEDGAVRLLDELRATV